MFSYPPHIIFLASPLLIFPPKNNNPPYPVLTRKVKYGKYDEMVNVKNGKLKTKGTQRFTDFSISGVKGNIARKDVIE